MSAEAFYAAVGDGLGFAAIILFRIGAVISVMPGIGTQSLPLRVRLALAISLSAFFAVLLFDPAAPVPAPGLALLAGETIIGLAIGLAFRLMIFALHTAGTIAAQSTSLSQIFGTAGVEPMPAIGHVLVVGGLALMFLTGLHLQFLGTLVGFYDIWPIGARPAAGEFAMWIAGHVSATFTLAFRLAVPFVILSMLYNVMLGVINKAMPQLMVSFVGAPVITLGGLMFLALSAPYMLALWQAAVARFLSHPLGGP
ncbi:flagellar biosynthetic protein FliR [Marinovum sp.]|uniref:flagellar biosynthetic protein FliR n=1 Tax=Marinovum sp. TaxID=2024839 RepID=UPI002B26D459|nr:flagellar biosynthetic protein FliR [Marinovum sp.]